MTLHEAIRAQAMLHNRRAKHLPADLGEHGWAILLDLAQASFECRHVQVSSAASAGGTPITTGLRYLKLLAAHGFITRRPDPNSRCRQWVIITPAGMAAVQRCFGIEERIAA